MLNSLSPFLTVNLTLYLFFLASRCSAIIYTIDNVCLNCSSTPGETENCPTLPAHVIITPMGGFTAAVEPSNYEDNKQPKSKRETNSVLQRLLFFGIFVPTFHRHHVHVDNVSMFFEVHPRK